MIIIIDIILMIETIIIAQILEQSQFYKLKIKIKYFILYKKKNFIFFLNIFIFMINLYLLQKKINLIIFSKFRNVDIIPLLILKQSFKNISNILNNNYFLTKHNNKISNRNKNKIISLDCVDFLNKNYCIEDIKDIFKTNNYILKIETENPDYLIYDVFGCEHLNKKYNNSIKIAYYTENMIPDFNEADYALSQAHFSYFDRYFKYPYFIGQLNIFKNFDIIKIRKQVLNLPIRNKFCAAVISNNDSYTYFRLKFIRELNKYKKIDSGGIVFNNVGGPVKNKIKFLSSYKFSISMENSNGDGYISEKIIEAFLSGTIPIYYGDYMIDEYINPKAYILIKGENDIKNKIEYIKKIDNDYELYRSILNEKILVYNHIFEKINEDRIKFLLNIFEQNKNLSRRIDNNRINYNIK